jgi:predicted ATPase/DNA-binding CsgD family transcriptional regulator
MSRPRRSLPRKLLGRNGSSARAPVLLSLHQTRPRAEPDAALPYEVSSFVGRNEETTALVGRLREGARLVTLVGIGGVGKTRLATHVAAEVQADYPAGACFVSLASVSRADELGLILLNTLGLREQPRVAAIDTVCSALRDLPLLLVLDNCEHVVEASAELVDELLRRCARLQVLATSREVLSVTGEIVSRVWPLAVPADQPSVDALASDAVTLFVERSAAVQPTFVLDADAAARIGRICRLLEGIPLAIELAAARTTTMSLAEIADGLSDPLVMLTLGPRTAPTRQQTLRATIDWSYALLTPDEQTLLRRLAVFNGGCTVEAAQVVCTDSALLRAQVPDLVGRLVAKSVLIPVPRREMTRFTMREVLRSYLMERLRAAGEDDAYRTLHRDWCIGLVGRMPPELLDPDEVNRLAGEEDNLRAALHWSIESNQALDAGRLAVGMAPLWLSRGRFAEARSTLTAVSRLSSAASNPVQISHVCSWAAVFAHNEGADTAAEELATRALGLAEAAGNELAIGFALSQLAWAAMGQGELERAVKLYERGLSSTDTSGPTRAVMTFHLAVTMLELRRPSDAERLIQEAEDLLEVANFRFGRGRLLTIRAVLAERAGDQPLADALLTEAVAAERALDSRPGLIEGLTATGVILIGRGQEARAVDPLREALALAAAHRSHARLARVLEAVTGILTRVDAGASVRMAAAAERLRDALGARAMPSERGRLGRFLERARQQLGERDYARAWRAGGELSIEEALREARAHLDQLATPPSTSPESPASRPRPARTDPLSEREREVVLLLTRGLNNREISDELVITRKTTEAHISHILTKLNLSSRLQIVIWARDQALT